MSIEQRVMLQAEQAARGPWVDKIARAGFVAKGIVYTIIGFFAARVAFDAGGAFLDSKQTLRIVAGQPSGRFLLAILGVGLACHAMWLFVEGAIDPERSRANNRGLFRVVERIGWTVSSFLYALFAIAAFQMFAGERPGNHHWPHTILHDIPAGRWVLIAIGIGTIGYGIHQLYQAVTARDLRKQIDTARLSQREACWVIRIGRFGVAARGVVLPVLGWLFIRAGLAASAAHTRGTGSALRTIAGHWGTTLVGIIGAGFIAYGLFQVATARYRRPVG